MEASPGWLVEAEAGLESILSDLERRLASATRREASPDLLWWTEEGEAAAAAAREQRAQLLKAAQAAADVEGEARAQKEIDAAFSGALARLSLPPSPPSDVDTPIPCGEHPFAPTEDPLAQEECSTQIKKASAAAPPHSAVVEPPSASVESRCEEAAPRVLVGPYLCAKSRAWLRRHGVTHIVNATPSAPCHFEGEGITYLRVPIEDRNISPIAQYFEPTAAFIRGAVCAGGVVLVHCHMGKSRSVALTTAYIMQEEQVALQDALLRVRKARPLAAPNSGFMRALRKLEDDMVMARSGASQGTVSCEVCVEHRCSCHEWRGREPNALRGTSLSAASSRASCETGSQSAAVSVKPTAYEAFDQLLERCGGVDEIAFLPGPLSEASVSLACRAKLPIHSYPLLLPPGNF